MPRICSFLLTVQRAWKIKIPCEKRTEKNALSKKQTETFWIFLRKNQDVFQKKLKSPIWKIVRFHIEIIMQY